MYMFFHLFLAHKVGLFSVHWFPVVLGLTKFLSWKHCLHFQSSVLSRS